MPRAARGADRSDHGDAAEIASAAAPTPVRAATAPARPGRSRAPLALRLALAGLALLLLGLLFRQVLQILLLVLITLVLAQPLLAWTSWLKRRLSVPRIVGALSGMVLVLGALAGLAYLVAQPLLRERDRFLATLPASLADLRADVQRSLGVDIGWVTEALQDVLTRLATASLVMDAVSALAGVLLVLVGMIYIAADPEGLAGPALRLVPPGGRARAARIGELIRQAWLSWIVGTLVAMVAVGALLYAGLRIIGLEHALLFAVLAGVLEFVPYLGPLLAAVPTVLFGFTVSPQTGLLALAVFLVVQQLEGHVILPLVMWRALDLHPAFLVFGVVAVGSLFGLLALFVAVPILSALAILTEQLWVRPREARAGADAGPTAASA